MMRDQQKASGSAQEDRRCCLSPQRNYLRVDFFGGEQAADYFNVSNWPTGPHTSGTATSCHEMAAGPSTSRHGLVPGPSAASHDVGQGPSVASNGVSPGPSSVKRERDTDDAIIMPQRKRLRLDEASTDNDSTEAPETCSSAEDEPIVPRALTRKDSLEIHRHQLAQRLADGEEAGRETSSTSVPGGRNAHFPGSDNQNRESSGTPRRGPAPQLVFESYEEIGMSGVEQDDSHTEMSFGDFISERSVVLNDAGEAREEQRFMAYIETTSVRQGVINNAGVPRADAVSGMVMSEAERKMRVHKKLEELTELLCIPCLPSSGVYGASNGSGAGSRGAGRRSSPDRIEVVECDSGMFWWQGAGADADNEKRTDGVSPEAQMPSQQGNTTEQTGRGPTETSSSGPSSNAPPAQSAHHHCGRQCQDVDWQFSGLRPIRHEQLRAPSGPTVRQDFERRPDPLASPCPPPRTCRGCGAELPWVRRGILKNRHSPQEDTPSAANANNQIGSIATPLAPTANPDETVKEPTLSMGTAMGTSLTLSAPDQETLIPPELPIGAAHGSNTILIRSPGASTRPAWELTLTCDGLRVKENTSRTDAGPYMPHNQTRQPASQSQASNGIRHQENVHPRPGPSSRAMPIESDLDEEFLPSAGNPQARFMAGGSEREQQVIIGFTHAGRMLAPAAFQDEVGGPSSCMLPKRAPRTKRVSQENMRYEDEPVECMALSNRKHYSLARSTQPTLGQAPRMPQRQPGRFLNSNIRRSCASVKDMRKESASDERSSSTSESGEALISGPLANTIRSDGEDKGSPRCFQDRVSFQEANVMDKDALAGINIMGQQHDAKWQKVMYGTHQPWVQRSSNERTQPPASRQGVQASHQELYSQHVRGCVQQHPGFLTNQDPLDPTRASMDPCPARQREAHVLPLLQLPSAPLIYCLAPTCPILRNAYACCGHANVAMSVPGYCACALPSNPASTSLVQHRDQQHQNLHRRCQCPMISDHHNATGRIISRSAETSDGCNRDMSAPPGSHTGTDQRKSQQARSQKRMLSGTNDATVSPALVSNVPSPQPVFTVRMKISGGPGSEYDLDLNMTGSTKKNQKH